MKTITPTVIQRTHSHQILSLSVACTITILAVLQLFWFEDMPSELSVLLSAEWSESSILVAALLVVSEVFAVAYFLPILLSPLARWGTRILAWVFPLGWISIMTSTLLQHQAVNTAYLGAEFDVPLGWGAVAVMALLFIAIVTVSVIDLRKS